MSRITQKLPRKPATKFPQLEKKLRNLPARGELRKVMGIKQARRGQQQRHS